MNVKKLGQVFTPKKIVVDILNIAEYRGEEILKKHIIDNSCGNGAFLINIIERYIKEYENKNKSLENVEVELAKYIHGIEIDKEIYNQCLTNLEKIRQKYHLRKIKWDIVHGNALRVEKYNGKMDYVVGNPPYVRTHNLEEQYTNVKEYSFGNEGMSDLYIVFYEIGFRMLNKTGVLAYITPNSFYNSVAAKRFRQYIQENKNLEVLMDLGHYQPFSVSTYTAIAKFNNNNRFDSVRCYKYDLETGNPIYIRNINYDNLFINNDIVFSEQENNEYKQIIEYETKGKSTQVKNAFATLRDKVFIQEQFDFEENVIDVIKASTGEWKKCIYPYDQKGNIIPFEKLNINVQNYLCDKKEMLKERDIEDRAQWYSFGRTQGINDVEKNKISINTTIKNIDSIKLTEVEKGQGIYSGLYIITDAPYNQIEAIIRNQEFLDYVKVLNKCKSGGYYTFSSKDLSKYINYKLEEMENE